MINGLNNSIFAPLYGGSNGSKRPTPSEEVKNIQASLANGEKTKDDLTDEEFLKLTIFEEADKMAFARECYTDRSRAQTIATKIARGQALTSEEQRFMDDNFPDLKRKAYDARKEGQLLEEKLRCAKSREEKERIINGAVNGVVGNLKSIGSCEITAYVKLESIQKAKEDAGDEVETHIEKVLRDDLEMKSGSILNKKA